MSQVSARRLWRYLPSCIPWPLKIALIATTAIVLGYLGKQALVERPAMGGLEIPANRLDFGEVLTDREFTWRVPIRNVSTRQIDIVGLKTSCTCVGVTPRAFSLSPGQEVLITTTIDLTTGQINVPYEPKREFHVSLYPITNVVGSRPPSWQIHGFAIDPFLIAPIKVDVGEVGWQSGFDTEIVVEPTIDVQQCLVNCTDDWLHCGVREETRNGKRLFVVSLMGTKEIPLGNFRTSVSLIGVAVSGERFPAQFIPVSGTGIFDIRARPSRLDMGLVQNVREVEVVLESSSGKDFVAVDSGSDPGLEFSRVPRIEGIQRFENRQIWRLRVTPQRPGDHRLVGRLRVTIGDTGAESLLELPVWFYAMAAKTKVQFSRATR